MRPISSLIVTRLVPVVLFVALVGGCASSDPAPEKKGWSLWPWDVSKAADATAAIEYHRTRSDGSEPMFTLVAHNTNLKKTIEGQMRTTMQTSPGDLKVDSQSFTLAPNEEKKLLVYPIRMPLTYEVTAFFRQ